MYPEELFRLITSSLVSHKSSHSARVAATFRFMRQASVSKDIHYAWKENSIKCLKSNKLRRNWIVMVESMRKSFNWKKTESALFSSSVSHQKYRLSSVGVKRIALNSSFRVDKHCKLRSWAADISR